MAGDFVLVECPECGNEQIVFGKAASEVTCAECGETLARPGGGLATIEGEILEVVESRSAPAP